MYADCKRLGAGILHFIKSIKTFESKHRKSTPAIDGKLYQTIPYNSPLCTFYLFYTLYTAKNLSLTPTLTHSITFPRSMQYKRPKHDRQNRKRLALSLFSFQPVSFSSSSAASSHSRV